MSKEAMKLALKKFTNMKELCDKHGEKINRKHVYGSALVEYFDVVCQALTEQPAQQEPVDFASLLREAEEIVREKPTWKRFIDGTPLANDIAVWMTVFAQDVARRTSPQPAQLSKPLTDEQIAEIAAQGHQRWIEFARAIESAHGIKENT